MLSVGVGVIVVNFNLLGGIIEVGFNICGVILNNEVIVFVVQKMLGVEIMSILLLGFIFNLIIVCCIKYKYIFLIGYYLFFFVCLFFVVLQVVEFQGWMLILIGGFLLGLWLVIFLVIGQCYIRQVIEDGGIVMGYFGFFGYYFLVWIVSWIGNLVNFFVDIEILEKWGFLCDIMVIIGIVMFVIYFVCSVVVGLVYLSIIID